jgi:predicted Zn finger-like uncharacterized protein
MPISATCSHCQAVYLAEDRFLGKKMRCKKCKQTFVIRAPAPAPAPTKQAAAVVGGKSGPPKGPTSTAGRAKRPPAREEDEPRPRRRRKGRGLAIGLIAGGAFVLVAVGVVVIVLASRSSRGRGPGGAGADFGGYWPVPMPAPRHFPPDQVVTLHIVGVVDKDTSMAIRETLGALTPPGGFLVTASESGRMTAEMAPVADPAALAQKIDFGEVHGVEGRLILVAARRQGPPPGADEVARALYYLKARQGHRRMDALGKLGHAAPDHRRPEVTRAVEPLLHDPDFGVRHSALRAFCAWAGKENVPTLLNMLKNKDTRRDAVLTLGRLRDERAVEPLADCLEDFFVRHDAGVALKGYGPAAEGALVKRLGHRDHDVRWAACEILRETGTRASLPALEQVAADPEAGLRSRAREAIDAITARK